MGDSDANPLGTVIHWGQHWGPTVDNDRDPMGTVMGTMTGTHRGQCWGPIGDNNPLRTVIETRWRIAMKTNAGDNDGNSDGDNDQDPLGTVMGTMTGTHWGHRGYRGTLRGRGGLGHAVLGQMEAEGEGQRPRPQPRWPRWPWWPWWPRWPWQALPAGGGQRQLQTLPLRREEEEAFRGGGGGKWEGTIGTMETIWVTVLPRWHCPQGVLVPPGGSPPKAGGKGGFWGCPQWFNWGGVGVRTSPVFGDIPVALGVSPESSPCPRCPPRMSPMGLGVPKGEWGCVTVPPLPPQWLWVSILGGGGCSRPHFGAVPCPQSAPPLQLCPQCPLSMGMSFVP